MLPSYDMPLYRPPSEGRNVIVQATLGCSFNACAFCSMYKTKRYRVRPETEVFADVDAWARLVPGARRVFVADGDALALPTDALLRLLHRLRGAFPALERVAIYATPGNLTDKSAEELTSLRRAGLRLAYLGVESGSGDILKRIRKGATPDRIAQAIVRARDAGIDVSATVILGLGGRRLWREHVDGTADLVNRAPPNYLSTLQLRLEPTVADDFRARWQRYGTPYEAQDDAGILAEQQRLLEHLAPPRPVVFRSNHASNCLPLAGVLPDDRAHLVALVAAARAGAPVLRPAEVRGL